MGVVEFTYSFIAEVWLYWSGRALEAEIFFIDKWRNVFNQSESAIHGRIKLLMF